MNRFAKTLAHRALVTVLGLNQVAWGAGRSSAVPLTPAFVATNIDGPRLQWVASAAARATAVRRSSF